MDGTCSLQQPDDVTAPSDGAPDADPDVAAAASPYQSPGSLLRHDDSTASEEPDVELTDGEEVYRQFKNRRAVARKRASLQAKRSRERAVKRRRRRLRAAPRGADGIVGWRDGIVRGSAGGEAVRQEERGVVLSSDEDGLIDLPDYLQKRRARFATLDAEDAVQASSRRQLVAAGARLPPTYDGIAGALDIDQHEPLPQKPRFTDLTPSREFSDVPLRLYGVIPAPIAQWLRDYQIEGAAFLYRQFVLQRGCILGDDMGLGKTVQVIAFLTAAYGKTGDARDDKRMRSIRRSGESAWYPRTMIICPGTLLRNWRSELETWGWWHCDCFHGLDKEVAFQAAYAGRTEILLTTYTTYARNRGMLNLIEWDCVIADECHVFKERHTEIATAINEVNALCRIGLTGTAVQNRYEELWTLLNWANPGRLGSFADWRRFVCEPLRAGQSHGATVGELNRARRTARQLVSTFLPRFFLRRMKSLIADQLPKKLDRVVFCPLTPRQADAYQNLLRTDVIQAISYVFPSMVNLQKLSNHLALLIPQSSDAREKQDKEIATLQCAVPDDWETLCQTRDSIVHYSNPQFCGKWK
ncbi:hypothetical protein KEM52_002206, partial [Ascosphaera acerosa]